MCVAVILPEKANTPTLADLQSMARTNPHGAGLAWVNTKEHVVKWEKGIFNMQYLFDRLERVPRPTLLHFRLSSIGGQSLNLCHPFPVELNPRTHLKGTAKQVLIHNGHWSHYSTAMMFLPDYIKGKQHSDTRVIAHLAAISQSEIYLKGVAKQGQRLATLSATGEIVQYGDWHKQPDGTRYSNLYWKEKPTLDIKEYVKSLLCHSKSETSSYQRMSEAEYSALMKECGNE